MMYYYALFHFFDKPKINLAFNKTSQLSLLSKNLPRWRWFPPLFTRNNPKQSTLKNFNIFFSGQGGQPGSSGSSDKVGPDGLYFNLNDNAGRGSNGHNGVHAGSNGDNDLFSTSGGLNSPFRYVEKNCENNMSQLFIKHKEAFRS